jgi:hypothetical protein
MWTAEKKAEYMRKWRDENRDKLDSYRGRDYAKHREERLAAVKERYSKNPEQKLAYARKYREKYPEKLRAYRAKHREKMLPIHKAYYHANKEKAAERSKRWHEANPDYRKTHFNKYYHANRDKIRTYKRVYLRKKRQIDPLFRLQSNLRARIHQALKSRKPPSERTMKSTGCTIQFLKGWLESRFLPGMSWDNYGNHGWHVDHVIPCNAFDLNDPAQALQCFHYSNLQPLWAKDNLQKGHKHFAGEPERIRNKTTGSADNVATREPDLDSAANKSQ